MPPSLMMHIGVWVVLVERERSVPVADAGSSESAGALRREYV